VSKRAIEQGLRGDAPATSPAAAWVSHDLVDLDGLETAVGRVAAELGPIDVLVNCAGIGGGAGVLELDRSEWRRVLTIDLDAPVFLMQILARGMVERGYGRIVNVTSVHARLGAVGTVAYDVAKAGLENATRSFGIELAPRGVAVNAVAPGFVRTRLADFNAEWFHDGYVRTGRPPWGRVAEPEEIAAHVTWLASEQASYTSGSVLTVDGGLTATF
jgi:3-oxoacyl-[acyl-carrier protein] reductase